MDMPLICKTMNVKENNHLYTRWCTKIRFEAELRETRHVLSIYSCFEIGRLSYNRGKAYATMRKVIMGNRSFYSYLSESQGVSVWR